MIRAIISDFSRVLLFPTDRSYTGSLNALHKQLSAEKDYKPEEHFSLNTQLLTYYASLKNEVPFSMFTSDTIQDIPVFHAQLTPVFDRIFSASKMHTRKTEPEAYRQMVKELGIEPAEALYIDDDPLNISAAESAGMMTIQYEDNAQLKKALEIIDR